MKNKNMKTNDFDILYGKIPPHAIEVEEAVLGALMLEEEAIENVAGILDIHSFYKDEHKKIFEIIKSIAASKRPIDLLTVTQELNDRNLLNEIGGPVFITKLTSKVASAAHIESHARIIAEKYYLRESIRKATEIINLAYSGQDIEAISHEWRRSGDNLDEVFTVADTGTHIKQVLKKTIQEIETDVVKASENKTPGIPTGFTGLDTNTGGWRGGTLVILAARPGTGKTSLALYFALEAAKAGYTVNIFSAEMLKTDLARILIASESGVYRSDIRDGYIKNEDWKKINQAVAKLENLPILFRDAAGMNVKQICSTIRKNKKNGLCDFAIVDYLQLIKSTQSKGIRELEVSEISRTLKTTALEENIPILALSQLNREADGQTPKLSHLRESGAIEQDADIVMFLVSDGTKIRLITAKHRRGCLGDMDIYRNQEMTKFSEFPSNSSPYFADQAKDNTNPF